MRKLRLELDTIRVESFAVPATEARTGTVGAHAKSAPLVSCGATCFTCSPSYCIDSCWETCRITCGECLSVEVCN